MRMLKIAVIGVFATTSLFLANVQAQPASRVQPPSGFDEGLEARLTPAQLEELLPWTRNADAALKNLLETTALLPVQRQSAALSNGIQHIIRESGPVQTELLMRFVLNRALKITQLMSEESDGIGTLGIEDQQIRVLIHSAELARKYYQSDLEFLSGLKNAAPSEPIILPLRPTANFALDYAAFLIRLSGSILDASAQMRVTELALGFLQWDLYRCSERITFAPAIAKIAAFLRALPSSGPHDDNESVRLTRKMLETYFSALNDLSPVLRDQVHDAQELNLPSASIEGFDWSRVPSALFNYRFENTTTHEDHAALFDSTSRKKPGSCELGVCPPLVTGPFGMAANFDGQQVLVPSNPVKNNFALEFWVRVPEGGLGGFVFGADDRGRNTGLGISVSGGSVSLVESGTGYRSVITQIATSTMRWNHVVVSVNRGVLTLYLNGKARFAYRETRGNIHAPTRLGWDAFGGYFQGIADEVALYLEPMSDSDITAHYLSGKALIESTRQ